MDEEKEKETLKTLIRYIIGDFTEEKKNLFLVKNHIKSLPKKIPPETQKNFRNHVKSLPQKKWMRKEKMKH